MPYKVDSVTGEKSEYIFDIGGVLALKNFTARTNGERLIIQSATNANFTILDALVSEVEIDGVVYDNPTSAQEALQRLVFNPAVPVIMTLAQQQLLEGALQKGTYSGTASDLKTLLEDLIAQKVNKEENKGLISDTERTLIQENYNKRVVGQTITGDVNKVSTLILEDGSVIQAQFTDVAPAGPDVMLNSQNFDKDTGVLTGVRSDEQQITADLNGRWALLGHTHQIADVADLEDALNGKAEAGHTHAFSDLSGTEDIATKQEITDAVGGIKIGGRNIYKGRLHLYGNDKNNSDNTQVGKIVVTSGYWNSYAWVQALSDNILNKSISMGLRIKAPLGMKLVFEFIPDYRDSWKTTEFIGTGDWQWVKIEDVTKLDYSKNILVAIYSLAENTVIGTVEYKDFTIAFGNKAPDYYSVNPDDFDKVTLITSTNRTTSQNIEGYSQNGRTVVTQGTANIVVTINSEDGFTSCYQKDGTGSITFQAVAGKTLVQVDGTNVVDGAKGSTATVTVVGNEVLLRISNV
ncbi:phage tail fiber repeat family protein [Capnocytophaga canimorsus]|uniref:hypothetical protein n=1 Tax=Capnocytophaga canimorsus TaxID=28188 RepID=UPI0028EEDAA6|nr:hypothetical protein [Capnocytophaga canimorsus]MDT9499136.1 hypothetical protein [Capnocytophaga canimorsus]